MIGQKFRRKKLRNEAKLGLPRDLVERRRREQLVVVGRGLREAQIKAELSTHLRFLRQSFGNLLRLRVLGMMPLSDNTRERCGLPLIH